ncbi:MAG: hypothetical protein H0T79_03775 [Deltaproteobacteria bacterium]|nr:hypothetical protein [Deltaproteobacteria bacterium]
MFVAAAGCADVGVATASADSGGSTSPVPGEMTIPTDHPRLWFSTPELRARALANFEARYGANGESFAPGDDPVSNALGYLMTKNAAYARVAIDFAMQVTDARLEEAGAGVSVSDRFRWDSEAVALIYDWCHDALSDSERSTLLARWNVYVANETSRNWGGPHMMMNNYYWGNVRTGFEWGVATTGESPLAAGFIANALDTRYTGTFRPFSLDKGAGGVPQEGSQYGIYNLGYPVVPAMTARALGRPLYDENPFFAESVLYLIYSTTPAKTTIGTRSDPASYQLFPFGDDENWTNGNSMAGYYGGFLQAAATQWTGRPIGKYARHLLEQTSAARPDYIALLDQRPANDDQPFDTLPLDYYAPGPGYLFSRSVWGEKATSAFFQLGQPWAVGHHHKDYGTFQLWRNGRWLSRETVSYEHQVASFDQGGPESASRTSAHNGVLFEGIGNNSYFGQGTYADGAPEVTRVESRDGYSFASVDLSTSYRSHSSRHLLDGTKKLRDDNPHVARAVRDVVFVRDMESLVVLDRMESMPFDRQDAESEHGTITPHLDDAAAVRKTFLAHFEERPTIAGAIATADYGSQALRVITAYPANAIARVVDEKIGASSLGQFRLEVTTRGAAQSYFIHVLQGRDSGASDVEASVVESANDFTLTLTMGAKQHTLVFAKGMTSTGGSIDGAPFIDHVQAITVTPDGPTWGN